MRKQEFNSKLISLLPLDEAPVHVPLRRPRLLRFERLRVPVWNPYSRGRLGPAKSEDRKGGEGKTDANLTNFLSTDAAGGTPTRRHALGGLPTPPPPPENLLLRLHRKLPSEPPASTQEVSESEVPVHVHPFAARVPCDSKGSECQCGIHRAEAASALRSRKTQRAAKEKSTPISQIF